MSFQILFGTGFTPDAFPDATLTNLFGAGTDTALCNHGGWGQFPGQEFNPGSGRAPKPSPSASQNAILQGMVIVMYIFFHILLIKNAHRLRTPINS